MALLDVSDVICDPDFMDRGLVCERSAQAVGNDGLAINTKTNRPFSGVVTSDRGDVLTRGTTGERITGSIIIHTKFRLNDGSAGFTADIVQWQGRRYTVAKVNDYSHFGRGFVCATCDLIPLSG